MNLKKDGSIEKYGIPLLTLIAAFIVIILFITYNADSYKKDKIDITAREYLLKIETEGRLLPEDETQLINDLQMFGVKNISLTGTTFNKIGYGKKVTLIINAELDIASYKINDLFSVERAIKTLNISIKKSSTAKY